MNEEMLAKDDYEYLSTEMNESYTIYAQDSDKTHRLETVDMKTPLKECFL